MLIGILLIFIVVYVLTALFLLVSVKNVKEVEMFEGEPRYKHLRETGYHFMDDVYWDHKEQKEVTF